MPLWGRRALSSAAVLTSSTGASILGGVGRKKREKKLKRRLLKEWEEKRPKTFRETLPYLPGLFLRTLLVVTAGMVLIVFLGALGFKPAETFWFQLLVYLGLYLIFHRFILGPLAPPRV